MTLPVVWLMPDVMRDVVDSPHRLTYDGAVVERLLDGLGAEHLVGFESLSGGEGAVVVVPGSYYRQDVDWLNDRLGRLPWCVVLVYADESASFPDCDLKHENMRVWRQAPRPGQHTGSRFLPMGAPPRTAEILAEAGEQPTEWDWYFSGQVNHERRRDLVKVLSPRSDGLLLPTRRFGSGAPPEEYLRKLAACRVAPCPAGVASADSFRVWEALAAGALPVVDAVSPVYGEGFWPMLFNGPPPFPTVAEWAEFPALLERLVPWWPANATRVAAGYQRWLRDLKWRVADDIAAVSGEAYPTVNPHPVTVLVPTSPIPSHPSTSMIETTVASVRHHLPDAEILVMCDGVREEQEHRRADYEEYLHRLTWLSGNVWGSAVPLVFDEHLHQVGMLRRALELVRTPLVLFVEHDTPLVTDEPIDWEACERALLSDELRTVRFHYEGVIPEAHDHLMIDQAPVEVAGLPVIRTQQWSSRPHLSQTGYFRRLLRHFTDEALSFTEDLWHGVLQDEPWHQHRLAIYAPGDGRNLKRSLNLDGRGSDPKAGCSF